MGNKNRSTRALASLFTVVLLITLIVLALPATASADENTGWRGEYFANRHLSGSPKMIRTDAQIDFDWGKGAPYPGLPTDDFSVRWTREVYFQEGTYRFTTETDDGVRLWVDGRLVIDQWRDMARTVFWVDVDLGDGVHLVCVDYYEAGGAAVARLSWARLSPSGKPTTGPGDTAAYPSPAELPWPAKATVGWSSVAAWPSPVELPSLHKAITGSDGAVVSPSSARPSSPGEPTTGWGGEYYNNRWLSGTPRVVRHDEKIDFDWGLGSPAPGIPADDFSVRWTQDVYFKAGRYRFITETDDGVRLWVDGALIIDEWQNGHRRHSREVHLSEGMHQVRMEYYEAGGYAVAKLTWEGALPRPIGNVVTWVPPYPSYSWIKVYRLAGDGVWVDVNPYGYASTSPRGFLKIDGLQVDSIYGGAGHPYRIEQWINGGLARSVGNFQRGEPIFRLRPFTDNYTPW